MTARERHLACLTFGTPDKIPFDPGWPRESTVRGWHAQGLPPDVDWRVALARELGLDARTCFCTMHYLPVDFRLIPQFEEKVLDHRDGHYIVQDWKGNVCEISDTFDVSYLRTARDFVTRRWLKCPVETRADWEDMRRRYEVDAAGRFPVDFAAQCADQRARDHILAVTVTGPFWQLREWCGFEGLCMLMLDQPALVAEMAAFWTAFVARMLARIFAHITPDLLWINEDMAYKAKAMISPAMTRTFCQPSWLRWTAQAKAAGVPLIDIDSDGFIGELIPRWIESGINVCDPIEVAAGNDINAFRAQFGRAIAYRGGVDKRAMARGGAELHAELQRIAPVIRDGGFIPSCDHGVPSDVPWPHFVAYARELARLTGWC